jgi:CDP-diacylglycerol--glycerol-3-phosphate 3-phosphatidyltransferase
VLENLKPLYNNILRPLVRPLVAAGVHPNHLTLAGLVLFAAAGWFVYSGQWMIALVLVIAGSLLDGLDGVVAREAGKKSVFGAILDSSCDRLTEIFLIGGVLGYLLSAPIISFHKPFLTLSLRAWGIVFCYTSITMSLMVSYVKARCEGAGVSCHRGIMQRPERLILLGAGLLLGSRAMIFILGGLSILGAITVVERFIEAFVEAKKKQRDRDGRVQETGKQI